MVVKLDFLSSADVPSQTPWTDARASLLPRRPIFFLLFGLQPGGAGFGNYASGHAARMKAP
jgi:hypothetical protein